jgi:hypothetical protein
VRRDAPRRLLPEARRLLKRRQQITLPSTPESSAASSITSRLAQGCCSS